MLVILGAGASSDSGLPTYQNSTVKPDTVLNRLTLSRDPARVWSFLSPLLQPVTPGPTYQALKLYMELTGLYDDQIMVVNQNVDGLATLYLSGQVMEIHGNVHRSSCLSCDWFGPTNDLVSKKLDVIDIETQADDMETHLCPKCNRTCRPDIVLYRETPLCQEAIMKFIKTQITASSEVLVIGTSLQLPYLRVWINKAKQRGTSVIHLNTDPNYNDQYWEAKPYGRGGKYRSLVGRGERWLKVEDTKGLPWRPATAIEGLDLLSKARGL